MEDETTDAPTETKGYALRAFRTGRGDSVVKVGEGRYTREDLCRILEARDRQAAPGTAPASGLYLEQVFYSQDELPDNVSKRVLP